MQEVKKEDMECMIDEVCGIILLLCMYDPFEREAILETCLRVDGNDELEKEDIYNIFTKYYHQYLEGGDVIGE